MRNNLKYVSVIVVLFIIFVAQIGILPVYAASHMNHTNSSECTDKHDRGRETGSDNCSTPNCPLFLCLTSSNVPTFALAVIFKTDYITPIVQENHIRDTIQSLFRPPRNA